MREMIDARTAGPNVGGTDDLLSRLFSAREAEKDSPYHFSDAKLTGESILGSSIHFAYIRSLGNGVGYIFSPATYLVHYSVYICPCRS